MLTYPNKTNFFSCSGGRACVGLWVVLPVMYKPKSQFGRGTVKLVWNAAAKTAKPFRCFSTKPDTTIMGIIEGYHTNLGCREEEGG